jgi:hypothetical protein
MYVCMPITIEIAKMVCDDVHTHGHRQTQTHRSREKSRKNTKTKTRTKVCVKNNIAINHYSAPR